MASYVLRRLLLLPLTMFCILIVNFVIVNLAPGEPTSISEIDPTKGIRADAINGSDNRYLQFREHYGLTLPILFNNWPSISIEELKSTLQKLDDPNTPYKWKKNRRTRLGDQAKYIMPKLVELSKKHPEALQFFIRGGTRQIILGPNLTKKENAYNRKISADNHYLKNIQTPEEAQDYLNNNKNLYTHSRLSTFFFDTRFFQYFKKVLTLDFGTLRDDSNRTVIGEVVKRFKYSLTLSIIPMIITFFSCIIIGFIMAIYQNRWADVTLNFLCLVFYATPIFVVAPFLIEWAVHHPSFPISGFTSSPQTYNYLNTHERLFDIARHLFLPITAIMYGSLAAQSRLAKTAVLEVLKQDYVQTARAKGLTPFSIYVKHVGKNASITIVTSLASSLGIILGGSLIVETLFEIDGFGKFFYDAVVNRDYNVILFSAIAGSFLTLTGYLLADIAYTILDPRVSLE